MGKPKSWSPSFQSPLGPGNPAKPCAPEHLKAMEVDFDPAAVLEVVGERFVLEVVGGHAEVRASVPASWPEDHLAFEK